MIRRAQAGDETFIGELSGDVYAQFGEYREVIPAWVGQPGVLTFVAVDDASGAPQGFALIGFYHVPEHPAPDTYVADLLAIAVAPTHQGGGLGRRLLEHAVAAAGSLGGGLLIPEIRLTVADTNQRARRLFHSAGFEILDAAHGKYDGGQTAIRMRRRLP